MKCNMNDRDSYKPEPMEERDSDEYKYYPRPKPRPKHRTETILKCGTSMGSTPLCTNNVMALDGGYQPCTVLATVVLDTSELIKPTVKIDFSSLISFKTCGDDNYFLHLVFKLSKVCGGSPIPLGTWTFEQVHQECVRTDNAVAVNGEFVQETDAFCFSWCECDDCPDCCRYIVELVDQQCYNIDFAVVSNISLTALAVGEKKAY